RQHEQPARDDGAPAAMHQPADVGRQLLGLGAGQHHAVVQRVQEALLADPAASLHQLRVQDRDLPRRPAEADEAHPQPETKGLGKGNGRRRGVGGGAHPRSMRNKKGGAEAPPASVKAAQRLRLLLPLWLLPPSSLSLSCLPLWLPLPPAALLRSLLPLWLPMPP